MVTIVLVLQLLMSIVLLMLSIALFRYYSSKPVQYIQFALFSMFLLNIGYYLELTNIYPEAAMAYIKLKYCGSVFVCTIMFFVVLEFFKLKLSNHICRIMTGISISCLIAVLTDEYHHLFYEKISFVRYEHFSVVTNTPAFFRVLFAYYSSGVSIAMAAVVIFFYIKGLAGGKRLSPVFLIMTVLPVLAVVFYFIGFMPEIDFSPLAIGVSGILLFALLRKDMLFETVDIVMDHVIETMQDALIIMDGKKELLYMNQKASELFPEIKEEKAGGRIFYEKSEVLGRILDERPKHVVHIKEKYYSANVVEIVGYDFVEGSYILLSDRTDWKKHSDDLIERSLRAEEANEAKTKFLANTSHDIRTPINAILGMNEMILRESKEEHVVDRAIEVERAGKSLLSMVNNILDISKIEAGKMEIINVDYETGSVLNDTITVISQSIKNKKLDFNTYIDPNIPCRLRGDEVRIKQILLNLLTNAVKYTESGAIVFDVQLLKTEAQSVCLEFSVRDSGKGIRKNDIEKIFDSYERVDQVANHNIEGTGLGLAITMSLVKLMDSQLKIESEYGQGSKFSFNLTQEIVDASPMTDFNTRYQKVFNKHEEYNSSFTAPNARILVIDDNKVNLAIVEGLLKHTQLEIHTVLSGKECIEKVKQEYYHIIFLDHMMPEFDGIQTLHYLKRMEGNLCANTPMIALTANAISGAGSMYKSEGFDDYLFKPIDYVKLEKLIVHYLPNELVNISL